MRTLWFLLASLALPVSAAPLPELTDEPAPLPSGMDLLYSDRVAFRTTGEPIVTLGLMDGQKQIQMSSRAQLQLDFYEHGVLKSVTVGSGSRVTVKLRRSQRARRKHYVDVEGLPRSDEERLHWTLDGWRERGYPDVEVLEEGTLLGIGGRILDNRVYRVTLPAATSRAAHQTAKEIYERFGTRASPRSRLRERPWAELLVEVNGAPVGLATSYVRFASPTDDTISVARVEHGRGYRWHGYEDRSYQGEVYAVVDPDGKLAAVNVVGVERMLQGVVPSEIFASTHPEALKAQAVAARNTLLAKLGRRHHDDPFHVCSEQHCQVYTGIGREDPRTNKAIRETRGQALFFRNDLVDAVYSSTCGGHTEDNESVWGDHPNPALRGRPDFDVSSQPALATYTQGVDERIHDWVADNPTTYCSRASHMRANKFRWEKTWTGDQLTALVGKKYPRLGRLRDITPADRGRGGRVISLQIAGESTAVTVVHELPIRRLLDNLNSGTFTVSLTKDSAGYIQTATFKGGGWGHGVGMCQMGAIGRAEAQHSYTEILGHYYNGASLRSLYSLPMSAELAER